MKKDKAVFYVCSVAFSVNIILFFIKLYIGLRTNSISIYSDAVNNLFDSLSGLLTLVTLSLIIKNADLSTEGTVRKSEQLFSFLMALAVAFTGFYFAYSSVERLMYPTPVWYTGLFLAVLILTALIKAGMFF
ncbi:MAG: cation transporter, partial [Acutalibacteraceae bacterium]